ncbi:uncharacterized protein [Nicotiana tomentosiformis]|uniref:uncharacterized protein n=1 Tax=Nicotiana tomentosiformis TaxID=4098 RepID=UPI00388CB25E
MRLDISEPSRILACVVSQSSLFERIISCQYDDPHLLVLNDTVLRDSAKKLTTGEDGIKYEHHRPGSLLQKIEILEWKWEHITMDFVVGFPQTLGRFDVVWVIVDRQTKLLGTYLVCDTLEKVKLIQERLRTVQSRQKSYVDKKVRDVIFMEVEKALRVSPMKCVMRFGKKDRLSPRCIGSFEVLEKVGEVAYRLALPPSLWGVHSVFYIFMFQKYYKDESHVLDFSLM